MHRQGNHYNIYGLKVSKCRQYSFKLVNMFWHYFQILDMEKFIMQGRKKIQFLILETISIVNKILNKKWDKYTFINEERKVITSGT